MEWLCPKGKETGTDHNNDNNNINNNKSILKKVFSYTNVRYDENGFFFVIFYLMLQSIYLTLIWTVNLKQTSVCVFLRCCKKELRVPEDGADRGREASEQKVTSTKKGSLIVD